MVFELYPASKEALLLYQRGMSKHAKTLEILGQANFSDELRTELLKTLNQDDVKLIEYVTRMGDFGNSVAAKDHQRAVNLLLKKGNVKMPRGKRANPSLVAIVARLTPILLHVGLPLATSERSRLVLVLRMIANEVGVVGDPRDELRRLYRLL